MRSHMMAVLTGFACCALVASAAEVTFTIDSPDDGGTVAAGAAVTWTISIQESDSTGSQGIALAVVDLVQDANNPESIDIPPGDEGSIGLTGFNRPDGISNPGEGGATTGFIGVQRGTAGAQNLIQIGGGQNTFGQAGSAMGTDFNVDGGVGQGSAEVLVSGTIIAPATGGVYTFSLANALANTLDSVETPPNFSPVSAATTVATDSISFTVGQLLLGDVNCDGLVDVGDISPFINALLDAERYAQRFPDCNRLSADINEDGDVDAGDISPFVRCVLDSGCPE